LKTEGQSSPPPFELARRPIEIDCSRRPVGW
jgi:hypothetical protein